MILGMEVKLLGKGADETDEPKGYVQTERLVWPGLESAQ
jgi:hypothetical protein